MKHPLFKILPAFGMAVALSVFAPAASLPNVQAAESEEVTAPPKVENLKAEILSETSVKLSWKKQRKAAGYFVIRTNLTTGKQHKAVIEEPQLTETKIYPGVTFRYQIYAYRLNGSKKILSPKASAVRVRTKVMEPEKVSDLSVTKTTATTVSLKWTKVENATYYDVFAKKNGESGYNKVGTTRKGSFKVTDLTTNSKYYFVVKSRRKVHDAVKNGKSSNVVTMTPNDYILPVIRGRVFSATMRQTVTTTLIGTNQRITIPYGTRVLVSARWGSQILSYITSDPNKIASTTVKRVYLNGSQFTSGNLAWTSSTKYDYTALQREQYVNSRGFSSPTSWLMWVDQYTSTTTFFHGSAGKWKQTYTSQCVVGAGGVSGTGIRRITYKGTFYGNVGGSLGGNAFHRLMDQHTRGAYSHGCIRLPNTALYYFWNNVPVNTTVILT